MTEDGFCNMRDIGVQFGKTSHQVGKVLKARKLRASDGRPTTDALNDGVAARFDYDGHPVYLWNRERIIWIFETFEGWKRQEDQSEECAKRMD